MGWVVRMFSIVGIQQISARVADIASEEASEAQVGNQHPM